MKKKLLLSVCAALAMSASAATYNLGEAFAYKIDPTFAFDFFTDGPESQYPADKLQGQASLEYGFGMANAWFSQKAFGSAEVANASCPVVEDPWNAGSYAIKMQADAWWAYGNFNFALPEVGEPSRVRVVYRVDNTVKDSPFNGAQKTFKIKLMNDADQDTPDYPQVEYLNDEFWNQPGWHVVDFISDLNADVYYLSILWDGGGLSCSRGVPFYVKEVSVVPLKNLKEDYTAPADGKSWTVTQTLPDLVTVNEGTVTPEGMYKLGEGFCYDIDPTFAFDFFTDGPESQYPADKLQGQASLEYGFGMANAWFSQKAFGSAEVANASCPVVEDPWNAGSYAIKMQADAWWAYGNFNFALPEVGESSRVRVIYRVDNTVKDSPFNGAQKTFKIKLMNDADQDTPDYPQVEYLNDEFWNQPGWHVVDFISDLNADVYYLSILWDGGGLSCSRGVPFYVKEVSVVPLKNLKEDYTAPADGKSWTVTQTLPALVKVDRNSDPGAGVEGVESDIDTVVIRGLVGGVAVDGFEGVAEVYNLVGQLVGKANVDGNATIAAPAGVAIVKAGNTVAKVIVR